jgi:hypothetical protein
MVVVHQYPPNYSAALNTYNIPMGPVVTSANWPQDTTLFDRVNGIMNCVFAYGGATLFNELMAEMRRPYVRPGAMQVWSPIQLTISPLQV